MKLFSVRNPSNSDLTTQIPEVFCLTLSLHLSSRPNSFRCLLISLFAIFPPSILSYVQTISVFGPDIEWTINIIIGGVLNSTCDIFSPPNIQYINRMKNENFKVRWYNFRVCLRIRISIRYTYESGWGENIFWLLAVMLQSQGDNKPASGVSAK